MKVTRTSPLTGVPRTLDLPITEGQLAAWLSGGRLIQDVFPQLDPDHREFIKTGLTPEDWERIFGAPEEAV